MKNKKLVLLIIILVAQIITPIISIYSKNLYLEDAEIYKISVNGYDPYDILRGKYLALTANIEFSENVQWESDYNIISKDENGYMIVTESSYKEPENQNYYKDLELDRYYINDKLALKAEEYMRDNLNKEYYLEVVIKNGTYKIINLYVDGVPIEEVVK